MFCSYEALSLASGSVIYMAQLRPAHAVLPMSLLTADALGSGVTLAVGDYYADSNSTDDPDRYLAAVAYNTAGQSKNLDALTGIGYTLTHEADIIVVTGGAEGSGTIELCLLYSGA